jgi:hypothetical protein
MRNPNFTVVPVLVNDEGPCTPVADDRAAEQFGLYEICGKTHELVDLYDTRAEAEQAARELA